MTPKNAEIRRKAEQSHPWCIQYTWVANNITAYQYILNKKFYVNSLYTCVYNNIKCVTKSVNLIDGFTATCTADTVAVEVVVEDEACGLTDLLGLVTRRSELIMTI